MEFKGKNFVNSARVHTGFHGSITQIDDYAGKCGVKVDVLFFYKDVIYTNTITMKGKFHFKMYNSAQKVCEK